MRTYLGAGWYIYHLTDRVLELRKDDYNYRQVTGRDGFVRVRQEPGMTRDQLIERAKTLAQRDDAKIAEILGRQVILRNVRGYEARQKLMANLAFGTPEDPEIIGRKRA